MLSLHSLGNFFIYQSHPIHLSLQSGLSMNMRTPAQFLVLLLLWFSGTKRAKMKIFTVTLINLGWPWRHLLLPCLTKWLLILSPYLGPWCDIQVTQSPSSLSASLGDSVTARPVRIFMGFYPGISKNLEKLLNSLCVVQQMWKMGSQKGSLAVGLGKNILSQSAAWRLKILQPITVRIPICLLSQ